MPEATRKRHIDEDMITLRLHVYCSNALRIAKRLGEALNADYKVFL